MGSKRITRRSVYLPTTTTDMLVALGEKIQAIDPWDRKLERQNRHDRVSVSEVADAAVWRGARQLAAENGIEFQWSKVPSAR